MREVLVGIGPLMATHDSKDSEEMLKVLIPLSLCVEL